MIIFIIESVVVLTLVYILFYIIRTTFLDSWLSGMRGRNSNQYWRGRPVDSNPPPRSEQYDSTPAYKPVSERIEITLNGTKIGWMETGVIKSYGSFKDVMVEAYLIPNPAQPQNLRFLGSFPSRDLAHASIEREFLKAQIEGDRFRQ